MAYLSSLQGDGDIDVKVSNAGDIGLVIDRLAGDVQKDIFGTFQFGNFSPQFSEAIAFNSVVLASSNKDLHFVDLKKSQK